MRTLSRNETIIAGSVIAILLVGVAVSLGYMMGSAQHTSGGLAVSRPVTAATAADTSDADVERLLFLIEEEKLAHDVYTKLYEKYNVSVFSNIARSETTHQSRMLELLDTRGIEDPRSGEVGVFKNTDLQALYDTLIAQGYQNVTEAYKVGVVIEQKDIADIENDLKSISGTQVDIIDTLNLLLRGSRNHLKAFNSQLG